MRKRRVRGFDDGTNKEDIKKLIIDINFLSKVVTLRKKVNAFLLVPSLLSQDLIY
jgi:hypothetical protein